MTNPNAKFKKGDRVIAISDGVGYNRGQVGTVDENHDSCPYIIWDIGKERLAASEQRLELIQKKIIENYQIY